MNPGFGQQLRVGVLETQPLVREGLVRAFEQFSDLSLAASCSSAGELERLVGEQQPDVLLLDPSAGSSALLMMLRALSATSSQTAVLVWNDGLSFAEKRAFLAVDRCELVERNIPVGDLVSAIRRGARRNRGETLPPALPEGTRRLTSREAEVARLASEGLKNREIAERLSIRPGTVKAHLMHVFEKTGLSDRQQLCNLAAHLGANVGPHSGPGASVLSEAGAESIAP